MSVIGTISLPVYVCKQRVRVHFDVIPESMHNVILGIPFLKKNSVTLKFSTDKTTMNIGVVPVTPLMARDSIDIPPMTEIICSSICIKGNFSNNTQGESIAYKEANDKCLLVSSLAVTMQDSQVPIRLYNYSSKHVYVKAGERLGTFMPWTYDTEIIKDPISHDINISNIEEAATPPTPNVDLSQSVVNTHEKQQLKILLNQYADCFVDPNTNKLGLTNLLTHKIELVPGAKAVHRLPYRASPQIREATQRLVEEQLEQGVLEETDEGDWASPALLVRKANGGMRMVIDYRALNAVTIPKYLRIPRLDEVLDDVGQNRPKFFSTFDLQSGYHQVPIDEGSRDKTAFLTHFGKFRYKTMPQGISGAPNSFQSLIDALLKGIQYKYAMAYIDDICCFSPDFATHLEHLDEIFQRLRAANLKLKPSKCRFAVQRVEFLGHVLQPHGISPNPDKIKIIQNYPVPKRLKPLRRFLGICGF